jgi:hypothetical protein
MKEKGKKAKRAPKKPQNDAVSKASSKSKELVLKPKYDLDLDSIGQSRKGVVLGSGRGLSLDQWETLRKKDPSILTSLEKQQLEETSRIVADMVKQLGEAYDTYPLVEAVRSLQTMPILRLFDDLREAGQLAQAMARSIAIPTQSLITFQKSFTIFNEGFNKQFAEIANAALASRSMFAEFQSLHTRVVKSLSIDIASLGRSSQFSVNEAVELDVQTVTEQNGHISVKGGTNQVRKISGYVLVHQADLNFLFTEIKATRSELSDFKNLIGTGVLLRSYTTKSQMSLKADSKS